MTKEMYVDSIKFIIISTLVCNLVVVWQLLSYFNTTITQSLEYKESLHTAEINQVKSDLTVEIVSIKNQLYLMEYKMMEYELFKYEEIPKDEFIPLDINLSVELQEFIYYLCKYYKLDFYLIIALIEVESGFLIDVVSNNNYGLMQINEINHNWLQNELIIGSDFLNPYNNLLAGCYMLSEISNNYNSYDEILIIYNLGELGGNRLFNQNVYETDYTRKIKEKYEDYGGKDYVS